MLNQVPALKKRAGGSRAGRREPASPLRTGRWPVRIMISVVVIVLLVLVVWVVPWFSVTNSGLEELERHTAAANLRNGLVSALLAVGAGGTLAYTMRTFHMNQKAHLIGRFESAAKQIGD